MVTKRMRKLLDEVKGELSEAGVGIAPGRRGVDWSEFEDEFEDEPDGRWTLTGVNIDVAWFREGGVLILMIDKFGTAFSHKRSGKTKNYSSAKKELDNLVMLFNGSSIDFGKGKEVRWFLNSIGYEEV